MLLAVCLSKNESVARTKTRNFHRVLMKLIVMP